jgi:hypothetical protein
MRASHPTLVAASRAIAEHRDAMAQQWTEWLGERIGITPTVPRAVVEAEFALLLDVFAALVGPLRRDAQLIWKKASEQYGRHATARGLAAGEVVEELQYLRELLIRHLAPAIAALRPRQGMSLLLRLNRLVDKGIAMAVIGYTDSMVATLLPRESGDGAPHAPDADEIQSQIELIRAELTHLLAAPTAGAAAGAA